ncbi:MAG: sulfatase [Candidatus Hydrogenedentota bacterium]
MPSHPIPKRGISSVFLVAASVLFLVAAGVLYACSEDARGHGPGSDRAGAPWAADEEFDIEAAVARPKEGAAPNVVFIVVDTLRAQSVGCYGQQRPTTPNIDRFAETATRFPHSIATASWTLPTHATYFTGRHSLEHGVRHHPIKPDERNYKSKIPEDLDTLAETFRMMDYTTGARTANTYLGHRFGFHRGFQDYIIERKYGEAVTQDAIDWIDAHQEKPFFLFLNYMDAHRPYNLEPQPDLFPNGIDTNEKLHTKLYNAVMDGKGPIPEELARKVHRQYLNGVRNADEHIGVLLDWLRQHDLFENSLIVITSDHGESFGEHHFANHGNCLYQEQIWVPLLIKAAGQQGSKVEDALVTSVDIPRLILQGLPKVLAAPHEKKYPYLPGNHPALAELYYVRAIDLYHKDRKHRFNRIVRTIFDGHHKFFETSDDTNELYNLNKDPGEQNNLINSDTATMREEMKRAREWAEPRFRKVDVPGKALELDQEQEDELKALGYL